MIALIAGLAVCSVVVLQSQAQISAPPGSEAPIAQLAPEGAEVSGPRQARPSPSVTQLVGRDRGALIGPIPREREARPLAQRSRGGAGLRLPAPPPEAVDICLVDPGAAPPGLDCEAVLEAMAAIAPPETRLLQEPSPATAGSGVGEARDLQMDADQVAKRLQTGVLAGSSVAQAIAAGRNESAPTPAPSPEP